MSLKRPLPHPTLASLMADGQALLGKSDEQLVTEIGFKHPNMMAYLKAGVLKLPYSMIPALASALATSPSDLLRAVLLEQAPELLAVIYDIWAPAMLSPNELTLIDAYRHLAKGRDVVPQVIDGQSIIALVVA